MASTLAVIGPSSTASLSVYTVSRMMSGGSAGFRTMIALPLVAPPTTSIALEVVSVNSSMFARVPGPATFACDRCDDLSVMHCRDAADCSYHGNGRLSAASHHIDVGGIYMV